MGKKEMHRAGRRLAVFFVVLAVLLVGAAEQEPAKIICPVCDKAADTEQAVKYHGGTVYLACPVCADKFRQAPDEFALKAKAQLVATGQARQVACPITGRPVKEARKVSVHGVDVAFCCVSCQGKVASAKGEVKLFLVFGKNAFAKGFKIR